MSMPVDELEVKTRHKKRLEAIRGKETIGDSNRNTADRRHFEATIRSIQADTGENGGDHETIGRGTQGMEGGAGDTGGHDKGVRPLDPTDFPTDSGLNRSGNAARTGQIVAPERTPEEKLEQERELARQRQARKRERDKEAAALVDKDIDRFTGDGDSYPRDRDFSNGQPTEKEGPSRFTLKNPFKGNAQEKVKLFTIKEAEAEKEHLAFIYSRGSGLLDDILEIIVKGHEKVSIWQLDDGEADMLAQIHLDKAKTDIEAARAARALLGIYDRIYTITLVGPRMFATGRHVKEHGGFSFR